MQVKTVSLLYVVKVAQYAQRIANDVVANVSKISEHNTKYKYYTKRKLSKEERLDWYHLESEKIVAERNLSDCGEELMAIGAFVNSDNIDNCSLEFPTVIDDKLAMFRLPLGQAVPTHWRFANETLERAIPAKWFSEEI